MMWPPEYEGFRAEARAVASAAIEMHDAVMEGLDEEGRMSKGRELLALQTRTHPADVTRPSKASHAECSTPRATRDAAPTSTSTAER